MVQGFFIGGNMEEQALLFDDGFGWEEHYQNMPEYNNQNLPKPFIVAVFKFRNQEDYDQFHQIVKKELYGGQKVFDGMQREDVKNAWYPLNEKGSGYEYS